jgi:hypothetical protein
LGDELRALRRLHREQEPKSPFVFTSERGAPFTTAGFARLIERAGKAAKPERQKTANGQQCRRRKGLMRNTAMSCFPSNASTLK